MRDGAIRIEVTLHYRCADRVCCDMPGCYVPFLGVKKREVRSALACELGGEVATRVSMNVHLRHEPGYEYIDHVRGTSRGSRNGSHDRYDESHFA